MPNSLTHTRRRLLGAAFAAGALALCSGLANEAQARSPHHEVVLGARHQIIAKTGECSLHAGLGRRDPCAHTAGIERRAHHNDERARAAAAQRSADVSPTTDSTTPAAAGSTGPATPASTEPPIAPSTIFTAAPTESGTAAGESANEPETSEACPNEDLMPAAGDLPAVRAATLCLINEMRAEHHKRPLRESGKLDTSAQLHSEEMVDQDYFEHTSPSGVTFFERIAATGYLPQADAYELGENIECATLSLATPAQAVISWMSSPEHRENILNGEFRETGIGIVAAAPADFADGQTGATYTQDFGIVVPE